MLTGNAICHRNPNWWIWCITTKNDPNEVVLKRAHASTWHARARKFWYLLSNQLYYRDKRVRWPQFCRLVKGCQNWYATSSGQPGDQSSVFLLNWHWLKMRSKIAALLQAASWGWGINITRNEWFNEKNWGRFTWLSTLASFFFPFTLSSYFIYN